MKRILIKTSGIAAAMALCTLANPTMAQDSRSSTIDSPSQTAPSYDTPRSSAGLPTTSGSMDDRSWGNQPRTQYREDPRFRGARGPIRSDDSRYRSADRDRSDSYTASSARTSPGEAGFIMWRESNTDTP